MWYRKPLHHNTVCNIKTTKAATFNKIDEVTGVVKTFMDPVSKNAGKGTTSVIKSSDRYDNAEGEDEAVIQNEDVYADPEEIVMKTWMLNLSSIFEKQLIKICFRKCNRTPRNCYEKLIGLRLRRGRLKSAEAAPTQIEPDQKKQLVNFKSKTCACQ